MIVFRRSPPNLNLPAAPVLGYSSRGMPETPNDKHKGLRRPKKFFLWLAAILVLAGGWGIYHYTGWNPYVIALASLSIVNFLFYGFDKLSAKFEKQRVPEIVLHALSLLGGFAGGWAGRAAFRHKTQKKSFLVVLILSTILHVGLLVWMVNQ
jgi:uncharacterized membrane protein YsdA (DUF1294 family)